MAGSNRILKALAIAMGLMAVSNFWKPMAQQLAPDSNAGFVLFGQRLHGIANAIAGPAFGALLAAYAYGAWTAKRWVVPIAIGYAAYVIVNLALFMASPPPGDAPGLAFGLAYATVAIGISSGGAAYLVRHKELLS